MLKHTASTLAEIDAARAAGLNVTEAPMTASERARWDQWEAESRAVHNHRSPAKPTRSNETPAARFRRIEDEATEYLW